MKNPVYLFYFAAAVDRASCNPFNYSELPLLFRVHINCAVIRRNKTLYNVDFSANLVKK